MATKTVYRLRQKLVSSCLFSYKFYCSHSILMVSSAWQEDDELLMVINSLLCFYCITCIKVPVFLTCTIRRIGCSTLAWTMFPCNIYCMLWGHRLLEIVNDKATLFTKAMSTMFVLVVIGSLLLFSSPGISKTAPRSICRTKEKNSESYNPETA